MGMLYIRCDVGRWGNQLGDVQSPMAVPAAKMPMRPITLIVVVLCFHLERFSLDVSGDSYRGFPGARKSDSASSDGNGGAGDGEGILEGSAHTGSLDRGDRRERTRGGASARRQRLDCDPLDRSLDDDRQRR